MAKQITLRNIPDGLHKELKGAAMLMRRFLSQDLVMQILTDMDAREEAIKRLLQGRD